MVGRANHELAGDERSEQKKKKKKNEDEEDEKEKEEENVTTGATGGKRINKSKEGIGN